MRYADGTAFRKALADRLRRQYPDQDVGRLQKRVAMVRFLARIVAALPERARLKGGYALEVRLDRARATLDVDLALRDVPVDDVLEALSDAAELELDDHLRFRIETTRSTTSRGLGCYPASANSCSIFRIGYTRRRGSSGRLAKPSRA